MKVCRKCNSEKQESDFYKDDSSCKECRKSLVRKNRAANADYYRAFDKARANDPKRIEARRLYSGTEAGKAAHARANDKYSRANMEEIVRKQKAYREQNTEKYHARNLVWSHLLTGRLIRPTSCQSCGKQCTPHGHHEDYAKPLDVMWLCTFCHAERHKHLRQQIAA